MGCTIVISRVMSKIDVYKGIITQKKLLRENEIYAFTYYSFHF